jgi:hypothetical protein
MWLCICTYVWCVSMCVCACVYDKSVTPVDVFGCVVVCGMHMNADSLLDLTRGCQDTQRQYCRLQKN